MDFKSAEAIAREQGLLLTNDKWEQLARDRARWRKDRVSRCVAYRWDGSEWRDTIHNQPFNYGCTLDRTVHWLVRNTDTVQALSCVC